MIETEAQVAKLADYIVLEQSMTKEGNRNIFMVIDTLQKYLKETYFDHWVSFMAWITNTFVEEASYLAPECRIQLWGFLCDYLTTNLPKGDKGITDIIQGK